MASTAKITEFDARSTLILDRPSSDETIVKYPCSFPVQTPPSKTALVFAAALLATLVHAESHPSWWTYASPEASALVGIHWDNLRNSPFAAAIEAELAPTGPLAFPDLDCLRQAREIVISSPELLAAEAGSFPSATVRDQAQRAGLHRLVYKNVTLWLPDAAASLGLAEISDQIVIVATRKTLTAAIDRSMLATGRSYSGLLPRAARFSQTGDLWVVAVRLPDPLASLFVPLDAEGLGFLGQVSVRGGGLSVEASFDASSTDTAASVAAQLQSEAASLPPVARGLKASSDRRTVNIELQASPEELAAALHEAPLQARVPAPVSQAPPSRTQVAGPATAPPAAPKPQLTAAAKLPGLLPSKTQLAGVKPQAAPVAIAAAVTAEPAVSAEVTPGGLKLRPPAPAEPAPRPLPDLKPAEQKPAEPQIVRITGLDDGPREIRLPPVPVNPAP